MKNVIIFTHGGGRFANQLTNFANFIAFAEENEFALINIAFNDFAPLIENYKTAKNVSYNLESDELKGFNFLKILLNSFNLSKHRIYRKFIIRLLHLYAYLSLKSQSILFRPKSILRFLSGKKLEKLDLSYCSQHF